MYDKLIKKHLEANSVNEESVPGVKTTDATKKDEAKVNKDYYKDVEKKMSDYNATSTKKDKDGIDAPKNKLSKKEEEIMQDIEMGGGMQDLTYHNEPDERFKERQEMAIKGDSKMGNKIYTGKENGNTESTWGASDDELGEKIIKRTKRRQEKIDAAADNLTSFGDDIEFNPNKNLKKNKVAVENTENNNNKLSEIWDKAKRIIKEDNSLDKAKLDFLNSFDINILKTILEKTTEEDRLDVIKELIKTLDYLDKLDADFVAKLLDYTPKINKLEVINQIFPLVKDKLTSRIIIELVHHLPMGGKLSFIYNKIIPFIENGTIPRNMKNFNSMIGVLLDNVPNEDRLNIIKKLIPVLKDELNDKSNLFLRSNLISFTPQEHKEEIKTLIDNIEFNPNKNLKKNKVAVENTENNNNKLTETSKMKRLRFKSAFNGMENALNLIPEGYKEDNKVFEMTDGNESYKVRWEGNLTEGKAIVLQAANQEVIKEDMNKIFHLMNYNSEKTLGTVKGKDRIQENTKFSEIWDKAKRIIKEDIDKENDELSVMAKEYGITRDNLIKTFDICELYNLIDESKDPFYLLSQFPYDALVGAVGHQACENQDPDKIINVLLSSQKFLNNLFEKKLDYSVYAFGMASLLEYSKSPINIVRKLGEKNTKKLIDNMDSYDIEHILKFSKNKEQTNAIMMRALSTNSSTGKTPWDLN